MHFPKSYHDYVGLDESLFSAKPDRGDVYRSATFKKLQDTFLKDSPKDLILFGGKGVGKSVFLANTLMHLPVNEWEAFYMHPVLGLHNASGLEAMIKNFLGSPKSKTLEAGLGQFAAEKRGLVLAIDEADAFEGLDALSESLHDKFSAQAIPLKVIRCHRVKITGAQSFELKPLAENEVKDYLSWGIKDYTKLRDAGFHDLSNYIFSVSGGIFAEMKRLIDIMLVEFIETSARGLTPELCLTASNKYYSGVFYKNSNVVTYQKSIKHAS